MILIIDNYERDDGCTADQMADALVARRQEVVTEKNDSINLDRIEAMGPTLIILSPGLSTPREAGISVETVNRFAGRIPILGVGQGLHCIAAAFGSDIIRAKRIMYSKEDLVEHDCRGVFAGLPTPLTVIRSHSLVAKLDTLPDELIVTATSSSDHEIMAIRHRKYPLEAVQFRPIVDASPPSALAGQNHVYSFDDLLCGAKRFSTPQGNRIEVVSVTEEILRFLRSDKDNIFKITPQEFELLICDRLDSMGFNISKTGRTFARDGGIDLIACPRNPTPFPFILAVQAKHHSRPEIKTGSGDVRRFAGAIGHYQVQAGALITNTTFTPDAVWFARNESKFLRLRDVNAVRRWIWDNFVDIAERLELPPKIELARNVNVKVPRFSHIPGPEWKGSDWV